MAQLVKNVVAASPNVAGGVAFAPLGTALPTDASTALAAAFKRFGYISEDGVVPSGDAASTEDVRGWGGDIIARLKTAGSVERYDYTLVELMSDIVNQFIYGTGNVTVTPPTSSAGTKVAIVDKGQEPSDCVIVVDMVYKGKLARIVIPNGTTLVTGKNPLTHGALAGYQLQTTCLPDANGNRQYIYFENDDKTSA